ncbi:putative toxin-antitoxin system toxin component, PIN family [Zoogloea sp.]|uniref:putative toxin-antitoxin system toxin component, PIN family n=1 Tax=Zoogloea sp. TaxID=49181 RepID=UPI0025ED35CD|nr:putative toxin-antitoxin system toxin component, PIN family [Zoogloea sp.]MCK6393114.1 putative toxin-antitoxin system toxin component, PIN family [Zoogloea sp.]
MATYPLEAPLPHGFPVILDTNVVLSLWMFEDPALLRLRNAVEADALMLFTREDCLTELTRVLAYSQFKQPPERQLEIAAVYRARCTLIETIEAPACELPNCLDRDDQKFLEVARDSKACALLSRDKLVLKLGRRPVIASRFAILTPERFQALLP